MFLDNIEEARESLKNKLCPKIPKNDTLIGLMNNYNNEQERKSFSINVFLCDPKDDETCDPIENT
jgi:hypothetical protein